MSRQVITEIAIREAIAQGSKTLLVPPGAMITSLASEIAAQNGIILKSSPEDATMPNPRPSTPPEPVGKRVVAIGSDHGGFQLKEDMKPFIQSLGYTIVDVGTSDEKACDYPDFAYAVAMAVSNGQAWRGVMIDGAGIGSCVVANKVPGVRAACGHNEFVARNAREHNDTNVLTLGSKVTGSEVCKEILKVWLETWFSGGRHKKRVDKIIDVEKRFTAR